METDVEAPEEEETGKTGEEEEPMDEEQSTAVDNDDVKPEIGEPEAEEPVQNEQIVDEAFVMSR